MNHHLLFLLLVVVLLASSMVVVLAVSSPLINYPLPAENDRTGEFLAVDDATRMDSSLLSNSPNGGDDDAETIPPTILPKHLTPAEKRRMNRNRSIEVETQTWIWVPFVVLGIFLLFLMMSKKVAFLDGVSARAWLTQYISLEALVDSLEGADEEEADEQRKIEYGHLLFEFLGVVTLLCNFFFGNGQNQPYVFEYLIISQLVLLWISLIVDVVMIKAGYLRTVRSSNNKLRFAHCTYQALLFAVDELSAQSLSSLPLDCFYFAVTHYLYEAVGLSLEGLNMIGLSEFVIILLVAKRTMTRENQTTGAVSAFGITSLGLSCASIFFAMIFKMVSGYRQGEDVYSPVSETGSNHHHKHNKHSHHKTSQGGTTPKNLSPTLSSSSRTTSQLLPSSSGQFTPLSKNNFDNYRRQHDDDEQQDENLSKAAVILPPASLRLRSSGSVTSKSISDANKPSSSAAAVTFDDSENGNHHQHHSRHANNAETMSDASSMVTMGVDEETNVDDEGEDDTTQDVERK